MADNIITAGVEISANVDGLENINRLAQEIEAAGGDAAHLQDKYAELNREFGEIGGQQALIDGFRRLKAESQNVAGQLEAARKKTAELAQAVQTNPTDKLIKDFEAARTQAAALKIRQEELNRELHQSRQIMQQAGISARDLAASQTQLRRESAVARQQLESLNQEAAELKKLTTARHTLGLNVQSNAEAEIAKIQQALSDLKNAAGVSRAEIKRATAAAESQIQTLRQQMGELPETNMTPIASSIGKIGVAAAGAAASVLALQGSINAVLDVTQQFSAVVTKLNYAFDGAEAGAAQLAFVREEANRLGLELLGAADGYAQLASATKDLNITHEQTQQVFKGVASAAAAMGLNAEEANGVFLALSQIAGKGKVSMEELRGQLGERLTPAMAIAAKSMGVTSAELEKMVENGLAAEVFLPRFGAALEEAFSAEAAKNAESLGGQINLLQNRYNEFLNYLGESQVANAAVAVMKDIGAAVDWLEQQLKNIDGATISGLEEALSSAYALLKELGLEIGGLLTTAFDNINDLGSAIFGIFSDGKGEFDAIRFTVDSLNLAIGVMRDGVAGVGIAFNLFSGAVKETLAWAAEGLEKLSWGDWSRELTEFAQTMHLEAGKSFEKAEQAALSFESKAAAAWDKMGDTAAERSTRMVQDAQAAYAQAAAAAEEAAKKAAEAQIRAQAAVGTATEESAKKQAAELAKAATAAQAEADKAAAAWHKQMGIELPKAADIAAEAIDKTSKAIADAKSAAQGLGLDLRAAMDEPTPTIREMLENINTLDDNLDALKKTGADTGLLLRQALSNAVAGAANAADIDAVKQRYRALGEEGKLSMHQVELGILAADQKLQELKGNIDPAAAAFKKLGIESKEAMRLSAEETRLAFETVKKSGQASEESLKQAFANAAEAILKSGNDAQRNWVANQAAAYGYKVAVDATGKAALQAANETKQATEQQAQAHQQAAAAAEKQTESTQQHTAETDQNTSAIERNTDAVATQAATVDGYWGHIQDRWLELRTSGKQVGSMSEALLLSMGNVARQATGHWQIYVDRMWTAYDNAQSATQQLNAAADSGTDVMSRLAKAEAVAISHARDLDKTSLANLRAEIDKARQKMQQLADEAKQTREDLQASLDELDGDSEAGSRLAQQRKLKDLAKKRDAAAQAGNQDAQADYARAIELQKQVYARQQQKKAEAEAERQREAEERAEQERQREAERQRQEAERQRQQAEREAQRHQKRELPPPNVQVDMDSDEIIAKLHQRDKQVAEMAVQGFVAQLGNDLKRSI
ncbi:tape measure protein [Conchiformibius steedae]|uniref:Tape measure protein N-terminal domain-containing protein n=1 Tax=Conchiformibius steedae TaxID=153493 RepID=A0A3P2A0W0_9NEIS|nr:tape measure protein [Conchiformibius steedae]RRD89052.1 hypothetical protein EII21_10145 [Conchiformibius steedae]